MMEEHRLDRIEQKLDKLTDESMDDLFALAMTL
jgi:hypothetical protein